jgi:hypothetical protein
VSGTVRGCPGVSGRLGSHDWLPASPRKALTLTVRGGLVPLVRHRCGESSCHRPITGSAGRSRTTRRTMRRERSCQGHRSQTGEDQQAGQPRSGTPSRPSARRTMWRPRSGQPLWPGCQSSRTPVLTRTGVLVTVVTVPYGRPEARAGPVAAPCPGGRTGGREGHGRKHQAYIACRGWEWRRVHVLAWSRWRADDGASGWAVRLSWRLNHSTWWAYDQRLMHPV